MAENKLSIEKELARPSDEISIIKLVDALIEHAYESRASDIHIDPVEDKVTVRLRIDGVMHSVFTLPKEIHPEIISRIKVLSGLRTDEHQTAQDGRFKFSTSGKEKFDIRVSIIPTYYEENAVLRLLTEHGQHFTLQDIGLSEKNLKKMQKAIQKPYGMILVTGPTGSGKTTTLYTILEILNTPQVTIITIEDPIEYSLEGATQIQVNSQTNLTFANGLRAILRQDPNIIMVGEIRDQETAGIAVNAALTGHLLLSTLHTNDAATTLPRLLDMKVEPFLIASTVNLVVAQRLVRKLCAECKTKRKFEKEEINALKASLPAGELEPTPIFYYGKGCKACDNSGYRGRIGIYEILEVSSEIRKAILEAVSASEIKRIAESEGMVSLLRDGLSKAKAGVTSLEEVLRVMHE